jgi:hypothetical protein
MYKMGSHDPFGSYNIRYGQKKGQESNCQFDSRPLKVRNRPFKWCATYFWKALNKGYNFVSNLIPKVHEKCLNYALTNLLFGLCRSMWIINPLVTHPSLHPRALTRPSTFEVLPTKECTPTPYPSIVFTFRLTIESIKEFGGMSFMESSNLESSKFNLIFVQCFYSRQ